MKHNSGLRTIRFRMGPLTAYRRSSGKSHGQGFLLCILITLNACGGGSSGTGESLFNRGQIVDQQCNPVPSLDLETFGLETTTGISDQDGTFNLIPSDSSIITFPQSSGVNRVNISQNSCLIITFSDGRIQSATTYDQRELPECSVEGVRTLRDQVLPLPCGALAK